jgi:hypothetical protein
MKRNRNYSNEQYLHNSSILTANSNTTSADNGRFIYFNFLFENETESTPPISDERVFDRHSSMK